MEEDSESQSHGSIAGINIMIDGVSVLSLRYWGESVEPNLVAGFVSALASFAREVTNDGVLKTVNFPPLKIVSLQVMEQPQVIISITIKEDFPARIAEVVLQGIAKVFLDKYSQDILGIRGVDLTPEFGSEVHDTVLSSLKGIIHNPSRKQN